MKVLMLGKYPLGYRGGLEQVAHRWFSLYMASAIVSDIFYLCVSKVPIPSTSRNEKIKNVDFMINSQPISIGYILFFFKSYFKFDLYHVHLPCIIAAALTIICRPRSKVILHWHADLIGKSKFLLSIYNIIAFFACWRATVILVTSPNYAKHSRIVKHFGKKVVISPPTVSRCKDLGRNQEIQKRYEFLRQAYVLSVGRLVEYKGLLEGLEALKLINDCSWVIVGDGPLKASILSKAKSLGIAHRVHILSDVGEKELDSLYANCTFFLLNSINTAEAFGVVLIEAMAHGKALLSSRIQESGMCYVNQDGVTGMYHDPFDPIELSKNIAFLLHDEKARRSFEEKSKARFEATFADRNLPNYFEQTLARVFS